MTAFFCATSFQIMNAIAMKYSTFRDEVADVYILDYFIDADQYIAKVRETGLFREVYFIKAWEIYQRLGGSSGIKYLKKLKHAVWKLYYYSLYEKTLLELGIRPENYVKIFFSYLDPICIMLGIYAKKNHLNMHFLGFEDGNACYIKELDEREGKIERLFHATLQVYQKEEYWLYCPEQVDDYEKYRARLKKIRFHQTEKVILSSIMETIWNETKEATINEHFIFFDGFESQETLEKIVPVLTEACGCENIIYKVHPRRRDNYYEKHGCKLWAKQSIPFEAFLFKNNISNKVLVCNFSSACFNAKFMFDQEPTIIFLCNIIDTLGVDRKKILRFISKLQSQYKNKRKICVPENMDAFIKVLCELNAIMTDDTRREL